MKFTWWTYWVALRRARRDEKIEFRKAAFNQPIRLNRQLSRWEFTNALIHRKRLRNKGDKNV